MELISSDLAYGPQQLDAYASVQPFANNPPPLDTYTLLTSRYILAAAGFESSPNVVIDVVWTYGQDYCLRGSRVHSLVQTTRSFGCAAVNLLPRASAQGFIPNEPQASLCLHVSRSNSKDAA